jgi:hypothetical protein
VARAWCGTTTTCATSTLGKDQLDLILLFLHLGDLMLATVASRKDTTVAQRACADPHARRGLDMFGLAHQSERLDVVASRTTRGRKPADDSERGRRGGTAQVLVT